jgi:hypothetical protein
MLYLPGRRIDEAKAVLFHAPSGNVTSLVLKHLVSVVPAVTKIYKTAPQPDVSSSHGSVQ